MEGAGPDAGASPRRCLWHQRHEGDGLDGAQLLGPRRARGGLHSQKAGLPREPRVARNLDALSAKEGDEKTHGVQAGMAGYYGIAGITGSWR